MKWHGLWSVPAFLGAFGCASAVFAEGVAEGAAEKSAQQGTAQEGGKEGKVVELAPVTVSVTRFIATEDESPCALSTIDHQRIEERPGLAGVQSLLAETPGIQFARSGGLGGQLSFRGFNSSESRSMLTVDGDRYRGRNTLEFNMFDPNGIERIEVIRGPASGLYGADAMNGVVNIVTRRAKVDPDQAFTLSPKLRAVEWGSGSGLFGGRAELVGGGQGFDVMVGAHLREAGDYRTPDGDAKNSDYRMAGLDFNIGFRPDMESRWELSGRYERVTTGRAGGLGAAPGEPWQEVREDPIVERYLRLGYQGRNFGAFADTLDAALYVRDFETDIYQINRTNPVRTVSTHLKVYTPTVWGGHLTAVKALGNHMLSFGGDFFQEDFSGRRGLTVQTDPNTGAMIGGSPWTYLERSSEQTDIGVYVSDEWLFNERWTFSCTARADWVRVTIGGPRPNESAAQRAAFGDDPEQIETALTGSLGAVYKLSPSWHLVGNVAHGFRAPSGMDLTLTGAAGTLVTLPSPDLESETVNTYEAGVRWLGADSRASLTAYQSKYRDLISLVVVGPDLRQRQNISRATITGLELEGQAALTPYWSVGYMATIMRGTNDSSGEPLPNIAPLSGRLSLRYQVDTWYGEGALRGYRGKYRIDTTQERKGSGYAMLDLYAGFDLTRVAGSQWRGWKLVAGIENVFDQEGRNPVVAENLAFPYGLTGNPLLEPGRSFMLKLTSDY